MGKNTKYLTYEEFVMDIVNAELRPYDICTLDLDEMSGHIDGVVWYQHFTFKSRAEHLAWRNYVKRRIPKCIVYKYTPKSEYERIVNMLDFTYGLKREYELQ